MSNSTNGRHSVNSTGTFDCSPLHRKISELEKCNRILTNINLSNTGKIAALENKLNEIKMQINKHRTWTGMKWEQNPLAVFVADRIISIIKGEK